MIERSEVCATCDIAKRVVLHVDDGLDRVDRPGSRRPRRPAPMTLSRVMPSCAGTGMVTTWMFTFRQPVDERHDQAQARRLGQSGTRPNRKTTPRSFCLTTAAVLRPRELRRDRYARRPRLRPPPRPRRPPHRPRWSRPARRTARCRPPNARSCRRPHRRRSRTPAPPTTRRQRVGAERQKRSAGVSGGPFRRGRRGRRGQSASKRAASRYCGFGSSAAASLKCRFACSGRRWRS